MRMLPYTLLFLLLFCAAMAIPRAIRENSWRGFFIGLILTFFGVALPLFVFFLSSFMIPEWKGACRYGWLDCFITAKLVLSPLVLWATGSLYGLEVLRIEPRTRPGLVIGFFLGAVTATTCFVFGVACYGKDIVTWIFLAVPFYIAVWHSIRAWQLIRAAHMNGWAYSVAFVSSFPLWLISFFWSRQLFESLPDKAPDCFIVTAASRGHEKCVGPLLEITRHGCKRRVNQQLLTFWQLETVWQQYSPHSHRLFRQNYNRIGPLIARRIQSPWLADLMYLTIKPAEFVAGFVVRKSHKQGQEE